MEHAPQCHRSPRGCPIRIPPPIEDVAPAGGRAWLATSERDRRTPVAATSRKEVLGIGTFFHGPGSFELAGWTYVSATRVFLREVGESRSGHSVRYCRRPHHDTPELQDSAADAGGHEGVLQPTLVGTKLRPPTVREQSIPRQRLLERSSKRIGPQAHSRRLPGGLREDHSSLGLVRVRGLPETSLRGSRWTRATTTRWSCGRTPSGRYAAQTQTSPSRRQRIRS